MHILVRPHRPRLILTRETHIDVYTLGSDVVEELGLLDGSAAAAAIMPEVDARQHARHILDQKVKLFLFLVLPPHGHVVPTFRSIKERRLPSKRPKSRLKLTTFVHC